MAVKIMQEESRPDEMAGGTKRDEGRFGWLRRERGWEGMQTGEEEEEGEGVGGT